MCVEKSPVDVHQVGSLCHERSRRDLSLIDPPHAYCDTTLFTVPPNLSLRDPQKRLGRLLPLITSSVITDDVSKIIKLQNAIALTRIPEVMLKKAKEVGIIRVNTRSDHPGWVFRLSQKHAVEKETNCLGFSQSCVKPKSDV